VWNNNWIAGNVHLALQNYGSTPSDNLKVSDCILPGAKEWNVPFLYSIFDPQIVNKIVNTPLYPSVHDDRLVWTKENNGEYFVRSAYCMCMQELFDVDHFKAQVSWALIWKLKMPPKVKNFIWRVCRSTLPTRLRLRDKGVNCERVRALCNLMEEDSLHLFFRCPGSCNIWSMCESSTTINNVLHRKMLLPTLFSSCCMC